MLALFRPAAKKNDYQFAILAEVDAITGTEIDSALVNATADSLSAGEIAQSQAIEREVVTFRAASALRLSNHLRKGLRPP